MNFVFILLAVVASANVPGANCPTSSAKEFEQVVVNYDKWSDNIDNPDFYTKFFWKDGEKIIKFADLSEFEKDQFYILQIHQISREMYSINASWVGILKYTTGYPAEINASKISEYLLKLQKIRTKTASKVGGIVKKLLTKHEDKFLEKESSFIIRRIERWHRAQGLLSNEKK